MSFTSSFVFSRFCIHYSLSSQLFFCHLITFANSLDTVQYQQNVGSELDTDQIKNKDEETSKSKKKRKKYTFKNATGLELTSFEC